MTKDLKRDTLCLLEMGAMSAAEIRNVVLELKEQVVAQDFDRVRVAETLERIGFALAEQKNGFESLHTELKDVRFVGVVS